MQIVVVPTYEDIYGIQKESYADLVHDIPSKVIITLMSYINNQLLYNIKEKEIQQYIFAFITRRFEEQEKKRIDLKIRQFQLRVKSSFVIFGLRYCMEFINKELIDYRDFDYIDTTPEQELRIFKAYLLIVEEATNEDAKMISRKYENTNHFGIKTLVWPHAVKTFEFTYPHQLYPISQGIKSLAFLGFCQNDNSLKDYLTNYLAINSCLTIQEYAGRILGLCKLSYQQRTFDKLSRDNFFTMPNEDTLVESFVLNLDDIKNYNPRDYISIKEKPIFKFEEKYCVINWNYLFNKLFSGLLFSFYKNSNIKKSKKFDEYKAYIGAKFSHNVLFRGIINECFRDADYIWFDDDSKAEEFNPDCYFRFGKKIFIIEFKDTLLNADIIHSGDFEKIKTEIDKKFIAVGNKKKGISQIIKKLEYIAKKAPTFDDFKNKK